MLTIEQQTFSKLEKQANKHQSVNRRFNAKGRNTFPIAICTNLGIIDYEDLKKEMNTIQEKKSRRSSSQRRAIVRVYLTIEILKKKKDGNIKI